MKYRLKIQLNTNATVNQTVKVGNGTDVKFSFKFVTVRQNPNECTIGATVQQTISNLKTAFDIDYNLTNKYYTLALGNDLYVEKIDYIPQDMGSTADVTILHDDIPDPLEIDTITYAEEPTDNCGKIKMTIQANKNFTQILTPVNQVIDPSDEVTVVVSRGVSSVVQISDGTSVAQKNTKSPGIVDVNDITITFFDTTTSESSIIINAEVKPLYFSLDGVNYQTSNIFEHLTNGNYILRIKDTYNCVQTKEFSVNVSHEVNVDPYVHISKSNSIIFVNRILYNCSNLKTSENSLSCETDKDLKYKEIIRFKKCQKIRTQFKTSYKDIEVKANNDLIPVEKVKQNLNLSQKIDAKTIVVDGVTYVYFTQGNIYDYDTGNVTGTHQLNGRLPEWANIGGVIIINGVTHPITSISFNENIQSYQIKVNGTYQESIIVGSVYNKDVYDIYEFEIDMANYDDLQVSIKLRNVNFPDVDFISEKIQVKESQKGYTIEYYNDEHTDIYNSGIRHYIIVEALKNIAIDNETTIETTDEDIHTIDVHNYEKDEYVFEPLTDEMTRKLILALSHQVVKINGQKYANPSFELETSDTANANVLTAVLTKAGSGLSYGMNENVNISQIPNLLDIGDEKFLNID